MEKKGATSVSEENSARATTRLRSGCAVRRGCIWAQAGGLGSNGGASGGRLLPDDAGRREGIAGRRLDADAEVVVGNQNIWLGLLLPALCGQIELRGESFAPTSSGPTTAAPPGVVPFLIASFVEVRFHPTRAVATSPGENPRSLGAGGGDGRVATFLKVSPWSC